MRNLLALGAAALILFVGLGFYLGWYRVQTAPAADGQRDVHIKLNTKKIQEDVGKGLKKAGEVAQDFLDDKANPPAVPAVPEKKVDATPTGFNSGLRFNEDGSVSYSGSVRITPPAPSPPPANEQWRR